MKVCIIGLTGKGGMVHYASQLSNAISKIGGIELYVILPKDADCGIFNCNITIERVPIIRRHPLRFDILLKRLLCLNPDIIHIITRHPWFIPLMPLLTFKKYPLVVTIHDIEPHEGERSFFATILSYLLIRYANKIFVHGEKLRNQLINKGISKNNIVVIPHGDYSFFTKYKKDNLEERNIILFFGRIKKYKGLEYLIMAEPLITKEFPDLKIVIAGKGSFKEYKKIKEKSNFEIFNEFVPDEMVSELFQKAKVVVLPYIEASQSGVIPIAYAFKKPVVATSVGSIPEIVEEGVTGLIVPPKDHKALAYAVLKLLKDEELRKQMGENAFIKMKADLSWDKIAEKTIRVYKKAIVAKNEK